MANETGSALCFSNDTALAKYSMSMIILATVFSVVNCFIVLANVIIMASIILSLRSDKGARKKSIGKVLMVSMAVSDFILGVFAVPLSLYELVVGGRWGISFGLCTARQILDIYVCTVSIYHVICMALDRYFAVCKPLLYRTLTLKTGFIMASVSWVLPAAVLLSPFQFNTVSLQADDVNNCTRFNNVCAYDLNSVCKFLNSIIFIQAPVIFVFILYAVILRAIRQFQIRKLRFGQTGRNNLAAVKVKPDVDSCLGWNNYGSWCCQIANTIFKCGRHRRSHAQLSELTTHVACVVSAGTLTLSLAAASLQPPGARVSPSAEPRAAITRSETRLATGDNNGMNYEMRSGTGDNNVMRFETPLETDDRNDRRNELRLETNDNNEIRPEKPSETKDNNDMRCDTLTETDDNNVMIFETLLDTNYNNDMRHQTRSETDDNSDMRHEIPLDTDNNHPRSVTQLELCGISEMRQPSLSERVANDALDKEVSRVPCPLSPRKHRLVEVADAPTAQNIKAVRTIGMIIVCFTLCWLPMGWLLMAPTLFHAPVPEWIVRVCVWLGYLNSALNPVVYCSNTSIRHVVLSLICRCRRLH